MNDRIRLVLGGIFGGLVQWFVGFVFWGTPLGKLAFTVAPEAQNAALQVALAQTLTATGSGTYHIPWPDSANGTVMHGKGPVALVIYNIHGFPLMSTTSLVTGLIFSIASMLLIGAGLYMVARRVPDFSTRARIVLLAALATTLYFTLGQPVFNFYMPWGYWVFLALSQFAGFVAGGLVLARWFLPVGERAGAG